MGDNFQINTLISLGYKVSLKLHPFTLKRELLVFKNRKIRRLACNHESSLVNLSEFSELDWTWTNFCMCYREIAIKYNLPDKHI